MLACVERAPRPRAVAWDRVGGRAVKEIDMLDFLQPDELRMHSQPTWSVDKHERCSGGSAINATAFVGLTSVAVSHSNAEYSTYLLASSDLNALFLFSKNLSATTDIGGESVSGTRQLEWVLSPDKSLRRRLGYPGKYIGFESDADAFYAPYSVAYVGEDGDVMVFDTGANRPGCRNEAANATQ